MSCARTRRWLLAVAVAVAGVLTPGLSTAEATQCFPANPCNTGWFSCTSDCADLVGPAKGTCLRMCRAEKDACNRAFKPTPVPCPDPPFTNPCTEARTGCHQGCSDLVGSALGYCHNACNAEYRECVRDL